MTTVQRLLGLSEGLIYTEDPETVIRVLDRWAPRVETFGGILYVDFSLLAVTQATELLRDLDRLGWFPTMLVDADDEQQRFERTTFIALAQAGVPFNLKFEAKYDPVADDLPDFLWHVAPAQKAAKISAFGITPRSQGKLSIHPDRVYLTRTRKAAERLAHEMAYLTKSQSYTLFRVTPARQPAFDSQFGPAWQPYRVDPNHPGHSVYTLNNVPPGSVEVAGTVDTALSTVTPPRRFRRPPGLLPS